MSDSPIKILLVEDNPGDARLLQLTLAEADPGRFELTHVSTLSKGLERLREDSIDVVLLDLSLPDSQGLDTFLKAHAQARSVPFVVLTGLADEKMAASALREGAQDYLIKGQVDSSLLARSMRYAIERMAAEEALKESEERYRTLFEDSRDAIFISSPKGKIVDANQAALDLFGFTRELAIGSDVGERYANVADRERFRHEIVEKGEVRELEVKLLKGDGTVIDCLLTATRPRAPDGSIGAGVQGIVRDITERKRAEEALYQQARELAVLEERNRMAREIHDTLAQGFTGIVIQMEAAEQALDGSPSAVPDHLDRAKKLARESLQEARRTVWDLVPRVLEERPLEAALQEEVDRFPAGSQEQVALVLSGERRDLPTEIQAALLRICQESLTNVRRYAMATDVKVMLSISPEAVCLQVHDNGVGFDLEGVKSGGRRGGFGLLGMEQRARLLGGDFEVRSCHGGGTLVEVRLPAA